MSYHNVEKKFKKKSENIEYLKIKIDIIFFNLLIYKHYGCCCCFCNFWVLLVEIL